jgi:hypothetical protein
VLLIAALTMFTIGNAGGVIPFIVIIMTELFASYCLVLAVAFISESLGWAIGATLFGNLFLQAFLYWTSHAQSIGGTIKGHVAVWSPTAVTILIVEIAVILLLLGLTFFFQARKTDFI